MPVEYRIISIGTLSHNLLWKEAAAVRTPHATTTLVIHGKRRILVDPSLPGRILEGRLFERTGQNTESITDVFCTTLRPDSRRALEVFNHAAWWCSETELEWYTGHLTGLIDSAHRLDSEEARNVEKDLALVRRFRPAPEKFGDQVGLYPLTGPTVGCTGLLLTPATSTVVIAGPAAPTAEHIEKGMIWEQCTDRDMAMQSLVDLLELADVIVPGFDNVVLSPRRWI
ncbi:MAG TPA: hypothetical protein ENH84_00610 [Phycisphaerae bacterium]|nr:hypothetical protein [Phycisphaerae bacterium]